MKKQLKRREVPTVRIVLWNINITWEKSNLNNWAIIIKILYHSTYESIHIITIL